MVEVWGSTGIVVVVVVVVGVVCRDSKAISNICGVHCVTCWVCMEANECIGDRVKFVILTNYCWPVILLGFCIM